MFDSYQKFASWLKEFPAGIQVEKLIHAIGNSDVKGFIIKDKDFYKQPLQLEFIITTSHKLIQGNLLLDDKNSENNNLTISIRKISDIKIGEVTYSNQREDWNPIFKDQKYCFSFYDGYELEIDSPKNYSGLHQELIQSLL